MKNTIAILDYGSQYSQIIARRVREAQVYCELFPWNASQEKVMALEPKGFILSGGPNSVYAENAPTLPDFILESELPILGICYGMQLLTHHFGGIVAGGNEREYGYAEVEINSDNPFSPSAIKKCGCLMVTGLKNYRMISKCWASARTALMPL